MSDYQRSEEEYDNVTGEFCNNAQLVSEIVCHLLRLSRNEIQPNENEFGICTELTHFISGNNAYKGSKAHLAYELVEFMALGWEHHSGDETYPIPNEDYDDSHDHWDVEQPSGELRRELCAYIAKALADKFLRKAA